MANVCEKPYDVVSLGELLVDMIQLPEDAEPALFERNPGGACANLAGACARMGLRSAFLGKVGDDPMGAFALDSLRQTGADVGHVRVDARANTTIALASLAPGTDSLNYTFIRRPGADQLLEPQDLLDLPRTTKVLHMGSLSLTHEPARSTTFEAVEMASNAGALVSYDLNYRSFSWDDTAEAFRMMLQAIGTSNLLKVNEEEARLIYRHLQGRAASADAGWSAIAETLLYLGPDLVAITRGPAGAFVATSNARADIPGFPARTVRDTAGAGDNFWGAFLAHLLQTEQVQGIEDITSLKNDQLQACGAFACAAATFSVERPGGMASSPTWAEVIRFMEQL